MRYYKVMHLNKLIAIACYEERTRIECKVFDLEVWRDICHGCMEFRRIGKKKYDYYKKVIL